jgi:hypothetical protein
MDDKTDQSRVAWGWKPAAILASIVAISTVAYNVARLNQYFNPNAPDLVSSVTVSDFTLPPSFWGELDEILATDKSVDLKEKYDSLESMMKISIRNAGNLPAKQVRLKMATGGLAYVDWDNGESETIPFDTELKLGEFPLEKSVEVTVWTGSSPLSLTVLHSTGKQNFQLYAEKGPPLSFWIFMGSMLAFCIWLPIQLKLDERKKLKAEVANLTDQLTAKIDAENAAWRAQLESERAGLAEQNERFLQQIKSLGKTAPTSESPNPE